MPARTGVSERTGNEWKSLPFVFEYKEVETDPYPDSVVLETFDTNIINGIEACCQKDDKGKLIVQKGEYILTREIFVSISFRHKAKLYIPKDGNTPPRFINDIRMNDIKSIKMDQPKQAQNQGAQAPFGVSAGNHSPAAPFPPQNDPFNQGGQTDDLPF